MRATLVLGLLTLSACAREAEPQRAADPSPSSTARAVSSSGTASASAPSQSTATAEATTTPSAVRDCEHIRRDLALLESKLAPGEPARCERDDACACYGGPICPNALVKTCPGPIGAAAERQLTPLVEAWNRADCGEPLWSPYGCQAACVGGRCASTF